MAKNVEFHPVAGIFPLLTGVAYHDLEDDIRANGLREAIILHPDGRILDGRNRYLACLGAGVAPRFETWAGEGSAVAYVLSLNLHRRHLRESGRAMVAARIATLGDGQRQVGQLAEVMTQPEAAGLLNVSERSTRRARLVLDHGAPELIEAVDAGVVKVSDAARIAALPHEDQRRLLSRVVDEEDEVKTLKYAAALEAREARERMVVLSDQSATLLARDWRGLEDALDDRRADLLLTDPPYMTDLEIPVYDFAREWISEILPLVADHGRAYICTGAYPLELAAYTTLLSAWSEANGWLYPNVLVWTYRNTLGPSPSHDYKLNWQAIHYLRGPNSAPLHCDSMLEQFSVQDLNAPDGRMGDRYHAWQKPEPLAERLVAHSTNAGALVVDPFAGTGTFLTVAARLGRVAIGCEPDKDMREIAAKRGSRIES